MIRKGHRLSLFAVTLAVLAVAAGSARAQEFVKVDEAAREQIPAVPFVAVAYGFIWVAVLVYVLLMARRVREVRDELREVRARFGDAEAGGSTTATAAGSRPAG